MPGVLKRLVKVVILILFVLTLIWGAQFLMNYYYSSTHGGYSEAEVNEFAAYKGYVTDTIEYCGERLEIYNELSDVEDYRDEGFYLGDFGLGSTVWFNKFQEEREKDESTLNNRSSVYAIPQSIDTFYIDEFNKAIEKFLNALDTMHSGGIDRNRDKIKQGIFEMEMAIETMNRVQSSLDSDKISKYIEGN